MNYSILINNMTNDNADETLVNYIISCLDDLYKIDIAIIDLINPDNSKIINSSVLLEDDTDKNILKVIFVSNLDAFNRENNSYFSVFINSLMESIPVFNLTSYKEKFEDKEIDRYKLKLASNPLVGNCQSLVDEFQKIGNTFSILMKIREEVTVLSEKYIYDFNNSLNEKFYRYKPVIIDIIQEDK